MGQISGPHLALVASVALAAVRGLLTPEPAVTDCHWVTAAEAERILLEPVKAPTGTPASLAQIAVAQTPWLRELSDCVYGLQRGTAGAALRKAIDTAPDDERFDLYGLAPFVLGRL